MKAKINVGFSSKLQAASYTPVESVNSIELEIEYKDDKDLAHQIDKYHNILRKQTIQHTLNGAKELLVAKLTDSKDDK
jgi:hypothetical protein